MSNRIDSKTSSSANVTSTDTSPTRTDETQQTDQTTEADQTTDTDQTTGAEAFCRDEVVRGADRQTEFQQMTTGEDPAEEAATCGGTDTEETTSVMEMRAAQSASQKGVDLDDHDFAKELTGDVFQNEKLDLFDKPPEKIDDAFNSALADKWNANYKFADNGEILADREALEMFIGKKLAARGDAPDDAAEIDRVASRLADNVEDRALRGVADQVESRAEHQIDGAREQIGKINDSSESRRAFLAQIAEMEGNAGVIEQRLSAMGIDEGKAKDIAPIVAELHDDPDAIAKLEAGEAGPEVGQIFKDGAYNRADELLGEGLDEMDGKLERLASDALGKRATNKDGRLLADPNFAQARAEVFKDMGIEDDSSARGLDRVISEKLDEVEADKKIEKWTKTGVAIGIGALGGVATGGLGAAMVGAAIQGGAGVGIAQEDLELARAAEQANLGEEGVVADATTDRNAEIVKAAAGVMLAGSGAGGKVSDTVGKHGAREWIRNAGDAIGGATGATIGEGVNYGVDAAADVIKE